MEDKSVDFRKLLPEDEISSMDVYNSDRLSPSKKPIMQSSENMRPKRNLDSSNYLTKKYLYQSEKQHEIRDGSSQKKRIASSEISESARNIARTKKIKTLPDTFADEENIGEWGTSSEGENIFESPKYHQDQNQIKGSRVAQKIYGIIDPDQLHKRDEEEPDNAERGNFEQAYLNNDVSSDEQKMDYNYMYQEHDGHMVGHKEKIRYYSKADMVDQNSLDPNEKIQYTENSAEDLQENYYRKRHSSENSKIAYNMSLNSSNMTNPLDGSYISNKVAVNSSYASYSNSNSVTSTSNAGNNHLFVGGANSRKRPTILKRNNANGNGGSTSSNVSSSNYSSSSGSNPKIPPPMSRYPPPKFLTRQLVQMAAAAQRNPNNAAAVLSARKVLSSVPPQLAASVVNSVIAASQTTNSTPQVIQLATAVATSQQAALASNDNMNDSFADNQIMCSYEDGRYPGQNSLFSSTKMSTTTVNTQFTQPSINSQQQAPQVQVTASDKLFGKKISGKYLPPPTSNISYPTPIPTHSQISSYSYDSNPNIGAPEISSPAVRLNVGGKKLLVLGGAAKKLMSSMHNSGQPINSIISSSIGHDEKTFDEIQGYIPHEGVEDNIKDFHTLEQNLVLDSQQIEINEH